MAESSSKRGLMIGLGATFIVAGLVAALLLWNAGTTRRNDAVDGFARAPVGCDTTLDFAEPGQYIVFIERIGEVQDVRGDCDVDGTYDIGDGRVDVDVMVIDPDGAEVDLDEATIGATYSVGGFAGEAFRTIDIAEAGDHVMRVESTSGESFALAVGRDPSSGVGPLRIGAIAAGLIGLIAGILLLAFGGRKSATAVPAGAWTPARPGQSTSPPWGDVNPGQPPYRPAHMSQPQSAPYGQQQYPPQDPGQPRPAWGTQQAGRAIQPGYPQQPQPGAPQGHQAIRPEPSGQGQFVPGQPEPSFGRPDAAPTPVDGRSSAQQPSDQASPFGGSFAPPAGFAQPRPAPPSSGIPGQPVHPGGDGGIGWVGQPSGATTAAADQPIDWGSESATPPTGRTRPTSTSADATYDPSATAPPDPNFLDRLRRDAKSNDVAGQRLVADRDATDQTVRRPDNSSGSDRSSGPDSSGPADGDSPAPHRGADTTDRRPDDPWATSADRQND